jgi:hypothetical protein
MMPFRLVAVIIAISSLLAIGCTRSRTAKESEAEPTDEVAAPAAGNAASKASEMTCDQVCEKNLELSYREGARRATAKMSPDERKRELRQAEKGWVNRQQNDDVMRVLDGCVSACKSEWSAERRTCENDARDFPAFQACLKK